MIAIYLKELKGLLHSFTGWLFLAVMTFFSSLYFIVYNFSQGSAYASSTLGSLIIILLFILPLLTMRIYAEEKRQKTDQLLITAPIRISDIIFGKFFALATILLISCLIFIAGIVVMSFYGEIPMVQNFLSLLGFFLFGCLCIAIGLFLSSITEHQFIAALLTYGLYIFVMLVPSFIYLLFPADSWIVKVINVVDFMVPFDCFFSGVIVVTDVAYIVSALIIFLVLSHFTIGKNSFQPNSQGKKKFFLSLGGTILLIAIIVAANIGLTFLPSEYSQFDFTKNQLFSITDETKNVLDRLEDKVTINVIGEEETVDEFVNMYVGNYKKYSSNVDVVYRSETKEPGFYMDYSETTLYNSSIVVTYKDLFRVINYADCYEYTYDYNTGANTITGIDVEGQLTAAINSMLGGESNVIYELIGHNDISLQEYITKRFNKGGYVHRYLNLLQEEAVPEDADVVIVSSPTTDLSKDEINKLNEFVNKGGDLIMLASYSTTDSPNYDAFIESFGVEMTEGVVVEGGGNIYGQIPIYIYGERQPHQITSIMSDTRLCFFPETVGFTVKENLDESLNILPLFTSSDQSYAKKIEAGTIAEKMEGDPVGPFDIAFVAGKRISEGVYSEVVVIGCAEFLISDVDSACASANSEFFFNALNYISEVEFTTTIPVKSDSYEPIVVPTGSVLLYAAISVVLLPLAMLVTGIVIFIVRRRK